MGNIGGGEVVFIAIFALLVFGPRRLPEIARSAGRAMAEFRRATNELKEGFTSGFEDLAEPLVLDGPIKPTKPTKPTKLALPDPAAAVSSADLPAPSRPGPPLTGDDEATTP